MISENEDTPFIGQHYVLTCNITGTTFATYQWRKGGSVISGETGPALTFSPLRLFDGGRYSCGNGTQFSVDKIIILKGYYHYKRAQIGLVNPRRMRERGLQ